MDFDELLAQHVGEFGKSQMILFVCFALCDFMMPFNTVGIVFLASVPDHWCAAPELDGRNFTVDAIKNLTIPVEEKNGELRYSSCQMYDQNFTGWTDSDVEEALTGGEQFSWNITSCRNGWMYDRSLFSSSIVTQWDLVCDKAWLQAISSSIYMAGFMFGVVTMGTLSDLFGRKPVLWLVLVLGLVVCLAVAFSPNIIVFLILRFFVAVFTVALTTNSFVLLMEAVGPSRRVWVTVITSCYWTGGYLILAGIAYFIRDWNRLQLTITLIPAISLILFWFIPESPRWLYTQNKKHEADAIVRKWCKRNKGVVPEVINVKIKVQQTKKGYILDMLRTPRMRIRSLIFCFIWFVASFVYYGLSLNTSNLGGNPYVNFAISAAVEVPAIVFSQLTLVHVGRRLPLVGVLFVCGVALLSIIFIPKDLFWLSLVLANLGKFCSKSLFVIIKIYTSEMYPTVMRNTALGSCSFFARIGGIVAPFITQLGLHSRETPLVIFGTVAVIAGVLTLILPETRGEKLPETLEDGEEFGRSDGHCRVLPPLYMMIRMTQTEDKHKSEES